MNDYYKKKLKGWEEMADLTLKVCVVVAAVCVVGLALMWLTHKCPIQAPNNPASVQTTQTWRVTAYCPCEKCCGRFSDGITASGSPAKGKLIAAPKSIPFGTWINIKGYGYAEVLDRGGAIKGKRLDVFFSTHQEALNWGVQYLEIE